MIDPYYAIIRIRLLNIYPVGVSEVVVIRKIKKLLVNVLAVIGAIAIGLGALAGVLAWATPVGNAIASATLRNLR